MITPDFTTAKSEQYRRFRNRLIELIDRTDAPVRHAAELLKQPREDSLATTREKLKNDLFSLVLIGAFQSGKSTLFNYLCDGRELSPVGPGGGGIRTSGCRVSAYPEKDGANEYAVVSWRTKAQLLRSFGSGLCAYYEVAGTSANNVTYLTEDLINLDNKKQREELAQNAWKEYSSKSGLDDELMRFVMIVCVFYPKFAAKIKSGAEERKIDDAVLISSYPQDWESRWGKITKLSDITDPDIGFKPENVTFAFCGGVAFHLDSAILRSLGCVVSDCPGLFISEWDTEIAKTSIREADAVLYQFGGEKALTKSDIEALEACVTLGAKHKLLFGANLKIPRCQWKRIEQDSVIPDLRKHGFENPTIYAFHAGIALRAREALMAASGGDAIPPDFPLSCERAIMADLALYGLAASKENIKPYLIDTLDNYIKTLTGPMGPERKTLSDFNLLDQSLDTLSAVPALIKSANQFVVDNKFESILKYQGSVEIINSLKTAEAKLSMLITTLEGDIKEKKDQLVHRRAKLDDLTDKHTKSMDMLSGDIRKKEEEILEHYKCRLRTFYDQEGREKIKQLFIDSVPTVAEYICGTDKRSVLQRFKTGFIKICNDSITKLRTEVSQNLPTSDAFRKIIEEFDTIRELIKNDFEELDSVGPIDASMELKKESFKNTANMMLPSQEAVLSLLFEDKNWWSVTWDIITLGFRKNFFNAEKTAEKFIAKYDNNFREAYAGALDDAFSASGAPFQVIQDKYDEFDQACKLCLEKCKTQYEAADEALNIANSETRHEKIKAMKEAITELESYAKEALVIQDEITAAAQKS